MTRPELEAYIAKEYGTEGDFPWKSYPTFRVYRHSENNKWFAVIMDLAGKTFDLDVDLVSVVNLKCEPLMVDLLRQSSGFYPAYHMNKQNWISVILDGTVPDERIKQILNTSFELTK